MPANKSIKKVLVAPLDWGLGHATRCIPLIRAMISNGLEVIIAAEGNQAVLLQAEFPQLTLVHLEGYRIRYSRRAAGLPFVLLLQLPRLLTMIRRENRWLQNIIRQYEIDLVVSDNRYGLSTPLVPCVFITHQLLIKAPFKWLEDLLQRINYRFIHRFTACWVPDAAGELNAAGVLSHPAKMPTIPVHYIGLLSRFERVPATIKYDYCVMLSGPEPQRTLLENKLLSQLARVPGNILLVRGLPGNTTTPPVADPITIVNHLPTHALQETIQASRYIVCRSGYTTVMELLALQKTAILIPTPGQTEQEYLGEKLFHDQYCFTVSQEALNCSEDFDRAKAFSYKTGLLQRFCAENIIGLLSSLEMGIIS